MVSVNAVSLGANEASFALKLLRCHGSRRWRQYMARTIWASQLNWGCHPFWLIWPCASGRGRLGVLATQWGSISCVDIRRSWMTRGRTSICTPLVGTIGIARPRPLGQRHRSKTPKPSVIDSSSGYSCQSIALFQANRGEFRVYEQQKSCWQQEMTCDLE